MPFAFNGSTASLAPYQQQWQDIVIGIDHENRPVLAATKNVGLQFDACTYASYQQWSQLHGTSLTSVQLLNLDGGSFTTFNNANITFQISDRPTFEAGYVGRWSAFIRGITIT
jgi:hypothetical protein